MGKAKLLGILVVAVALGLIAGGLLTNIAVKQTEATQSAVKVVNIGPDEIDPSVWGQNFRSEYASWGRTKDTVSLVDYKSVGKYGGPDKYSKLDKDPLLKRLNAGNQFAIEYNEDRGHANALTDLMNTKRYGDNKPGACLTCKSPAVPKIMNQIGVDKFYATPMKDLISQFDPKHPISCADCHDPKTMALTVTRPAFKEALASRGIDLSKASRQDMRTYVCAQCHDEYYFKGDGKYVTLPESKGLTVENIEAYYDEINFKDFDHAETKAPLIKIQHPDYELWSTGVHARAGVSCADCHMPYMVEGGTKVSDHWTRSPLLSITNSCTGCHKESEQELRARVLQDQDRTFNIEMTAEQAMVDAQDAIVAAMKAGVSDDSLKEARQLQRRGFIRLDFVSAENSMGFHSPQEAVRILGDSINYSRQAQLSAVKATPAKTQ